MNPLKKPKNTLNLSGFLLVLIKKKKSVYMALYVHFYAKTTNAKLYIYIGVGARDLYIDEAHTALDIFRFAAFFFS